MLRKDISENNVVLRIKENNNFKKSKSKKIKMKDLTFLKINFH